MNQFMERQFANQEPLRNNLLIPTLESRIIQAAKLRGALAQMVYAISRNFTIRDTNQIMEQLIILVQGASRLRYRDKAQMQRPGHTGRKALATKKNMEQLIIRCQSNLNVYIRNEMLMHNHCMEIVGSLGLKMLDIMLSVDD